MKNERIEKALEWCEKRKISTGQLKLFAREYRENLAKEEGLKNPIKKEGDKRLWILGKKLLTLKWYIPFKYSVLFY